MPGSTLSLLSFIDISVPGSQKCIISGSMNLISRGVKV